MDELDKVKVARVIAHHYETNFSSSTRCKCGWTGTFHLWPVHVADEIEAALA